MEQPKGMGRRVLGAIVAVVIGLMTQMLVYAAAVALVGFPSRFSAAIAFPATVVVTGYIFYEGVDRSVWRAATFGVVAPFSLLALLPRIFPG